MPSFKAALFALLGISIALGVPALLSILMGVGVPALLKPFLFIGTYLVCVRLLAAKQFFQYQTLVSKLAIRLAEIRKKNNKNSP
jgi:urea transporter